MVYDLATEGTAVKTDPDSCLAISDSEFHELTLEDLARCADVHPELVKRFVEFGLLERANERDEEPLFCVSAIQRLQRAIRLRSLGINLVGVSVVLDLLDKLRVLQFQNEVLRFRIVEQLSGNAETPKRTTALVCQP